MSKTTNVVIAERLKKHADTSLRRNLREHQGDLDLEEMFRNDHLDLLAISKMIRRGDMGTALQCLTWLDTAVQDEIPVTVWMWVEDRA